MPTAANNLLLALSGLRRKDIITNIRFAITAADRIRTSVSMILDYHGCETIGYKRIE